MKYLLIVIIIIITALSDRTYAQERLSDPITYSADSSTGTKTDNDEIRHFYGNVVFRQRNVVLRCKEAIYSLVRKKAELLRDVVITQEDMVLKSPRIDYDGFTGIAVAPQTITITDKNATLKAKKGEYNTNSYIATFVDDVRIVDDSTTIDSDTLVYNRRTRVSNAMGQVVVETDSIVIFADSAENRPADRTNTAVGNVFLMAKFNSFFLNAGLTIDSRRENITLAYQNPVLFRVDTSYETRSVHDSAGILPDTIIRLAKLDTMSVACDSLRAAPYKGDRIAEFMGNVQMYRQRVASKSGYASYAAADSLISLRFNPIIWFDSTQLRGDSVFITMQNRKLRGIHSMGNALAASVADTSKPDRINQISALKIQIDFQKDSIKRIAGMKDAKTLYFYKSEDGEELAARNSSDSVFIIFELGEIADIVWTGGVQGQNFPDSMVIEQAKSFFLPNFSWRSDRPLKRELIIRKKEPVEE